MSRLAYSPAQRRNVVLRTALKNQSMTGTSVPCAAPRDKEELEMLAEKNPEVKKAVAKLLVLSEDERARMLAESREKLRRDISSITYAAEARGREEGQKQALLVVARSLLNLGHSVDEVVQVTGLSKEMIVSLLH